MLYSSKKIFNCINGQFGLCAFYTWHRKRHFQYLRYISNSLFLSFHCTRFETLGSSFQFFLHFLFVLILSLWEIEHSITPFQSNMQNIVVSTQTHFVQIMSFLQTSFISLLKLTISKLSYTSPSCEASLGQVVALVGPLVVVALDHWVVHLPKMTFRTIYTTQLQCSIDPNRLTWFEQRPWILSFLPFCCNRPKWSPMISELYAYISWCASKKSGLLKLHIL